MATRHTTQTTNGRTGTTDERFTRPAGEGAGERREAPAGDSPVGVWAVDPEQSTFGFAVKKMGLYHVKGHFREARGEIELTPDGNARAEAVIASRSIYTRIEPRDLHLRSQQFLHVGEHPEIRFFADRVDGLRAGDNVVRGELEIRGKRRPVELHAHMEHRADGTLHVHMEGTIDRHDFDVRPPQPFEMIVGGEVHLDIDIVGLPKR